MAYGQAPSAPPQRARPVTVTLAGLLLPVVTLCSLVFLGIRVGVYGAVRDLYLREFDGVEYGEGFGGVVAGSLFVEAAVYLLIGLTLGILAPFNLGGSNGARIATWVVGGLGACCGGISVGFLALGTAMAPFAGQNDPDLAEFERRFDEQIPAWYEPLNFGSSAIGVLALVVALILLALPASNQHFRRPSTPVYQPPHYQSPPGYLAPPAYPSAPGYPPPPMYPPPPPYQGPPGYPVPAPGPADPHAQPTQLAQPAAADSPPGTASAPGEGADPGAGGGDATTGGQRGDGGGN